MKTLNILRACREAIVRFGTNPYTLLSKAFRAGSLDCEEYLGLLKLLEESKPANPHAQENDYYFHALINAAIRREETRKTLTTKGNTNDQNHINISKLRPTSDR